MYSFLWLHGVYTNHLIEGTGRGWIIACSSFLCLHEPEIKPQVGGYKGKQAS